MFPRGVGLLVIIPLLLAALAAGIGLSLLGGTTIYPGVSIAGIDLGGLTAEQAASRLTASTSGLVGRQIILRYSDEVLRPAITDISGKIDVATCADAAQQVGRKGRLFHRLAEIISARWKGIDLPLIYSFDKECAAAYFRATAEKIDRSPANARPVVERNTVRVIPEEPGIKLDIERNLAEIARAVNTGKRKIDLVVVTAPPTITTADLKGIDGVIGTYSTRYKLWERDRTHNLKIACRAVDGALVKPGGVFSYNKIVGPRLEEYGYRDAPIFVKGKVEHGTGGGVCQVSTTVYNAALLANMKILKRSHHSRPVAYAPIGRDATVTYPSLDLKFENTSKSPVYILASVSKRAVSVSILGKKQEGQEIEIVAVGHRIIAAPIIKSLDDSLEPGRQVVREDGRTGHRISIQRLVKVNGNTVKREVISNDYYPPENRVIAVSPPL